MEVGLCYEFGGLIFGGPTRAPIFLACKQALCLGKG